MTIQHVGGRKGAHATKKSLLSLLFLMFLLYGLISLQFVSQDENVQNPASEKETIRKPGNQRQQRKLPPTPEKHFPYWRDLAVKLAALPPDQVLTTLETQDPFGVRHFEEMLLQTESSKGAFLDLNELRSLFSCPVDRITLPDQRNHDKAQAFRNGTLTHFLFFQHLRKAGGTNFCALAEHNLPKYQLPKYYCMPDYHWEKKKCAGCFSAYKNDEIIHNMNAKNHRILGNEWDAFEPDRMFDLPAVFATSFRRPLDRALSQFRFECIEERVSGPRRSIPQYLCSLLCSALTMIFPTFLLSRAVKSKTLPNGGKKERCEYCRDRFGFRSTCLSNIPLLLSQQNLNLQDLVNAYTWTFTNQPIRKISIGTSTKDSEARQQTLGLALDTVARFNLVLAMEWLAYAPTHTQNVLGFKDTTTMTERVRPHITQRAREDGQEHNQLGAAGIAKASWTPKEYLSPATYKMMSENLALDEILTDAARRMFLERLVCEDV